MSLSTVVAMPHPDYCYQVAVLAACSGPSLSAPTWGGPAGTFVSKAGTHLEYAVADVEAWARVMYLVPPPMGEARLRLKTILPEATRQGVLDAMADAGDRLNAHNDQSAGGTIDFYYSGHGYPNGDLCLADGPLSPDELADCWVRGNNSGQTRHIRLALDCCHAGMTLARLYLHRGHWASYVLRDAFAASLPSQEAFELPKLGHGVLIHTMLRPDPMSMVGKIRQEGREPTDREIKEVLKAMRESTQYLTNGAQHALDMINGHHVGIKGKGGGIELLDQAWTLDELTEALDALPGRRTR